MRRLLETKAGEAGGGSGPYVFRTARAVADAEAARIRTWASTGSGARRGVSCVQALCCACGVRTARAAAREQQAGPDSRECSHECAARTHQRAGRVRQGAPRWVLGERELGVLSAGRVKSRSSVDRCRFILSSDGEHKCAVGKRLEHWAFRTRPIIGRRCSHLSLLKLHLLI